MYIREQDYYQIIVEGELDVVKSANLTARQDLELTIIERVKSFIRHRYDVQEVFKDILTWTVETAPSKSYPNDLIEYSATAYDDSAEYSDDVYVSYQDGVYKCIAGRVITGIPPTNTADWEYIVADKTLYYSRITTPDAGGTIPGEVQFTYSTNNYTGNHDLIEGWDYTKEIFLKRDDDRINIYYSANDRTNDINSIGTCVYEKIRNFPVNLDILEGDEDDINSQLRGRLSVIDFIPDNTEWSVSTTNQWTQGDNRNQQILAIVLNIALFEMYKLVSPRVIPELRLNAFERYSDELRKIGTGEDITADLPLYQDETKGESISYGNSQPNQNWRY